MSHCVYQECETCGGEFCARGCGYDHCICGIRCEVTGNQCGTDTWAVGYNCQCKNCQRWLAAQPKPNPPRVEPDMHGSRGFEKIMELAATLPIDHEADARVAKLLNAARSRSSPRKLVSFTDAELDIIQWNYETCKGDLEAFGMPGDEWARMIGESIAIFERILRMNKRIP